MISPPPVCHLSGFVSPCSGGAPRKSRRTGFRRSRKMFFCTWDIEARLAYPLVEDQLSLNRQRCSVCDAVDKLQLHSAGHGTPTNHLLPERSSARKGLLQHVLACRSRTAIQIRKPTPAAARAGDRPFRMEASDFWERSWCDHPFRACTGSSFSPWSLPRTPHRSVQNRSRSSARSQGRVPARQ